MYHPHIAGHTRNTVARENTPPITHTQQTTHLGICGHQLVALVHRLELPHLTPERRKARQHPPALHTDPFQIPLERRPSVGSISPNLSDVSGPATASRCSRGGAGNAVAPRSGPGRTRGRTGCLVDGEKGVGGGSPGACRDGRGLDELVPEGDKVALGFPPTYLKFHPVLFVFVFRFCFVFVFAAFFAKRQQEGGGGGCKYSQRE